MADLLDQFINENQGKLVVTNPADSGQCTAVSKAWEIKLGFPPTYGNAKDIFNNNSGVHFSKVGVGGVDGIPRGSLICYGTGVGDPNGHIAIGIDGRLSTSFRVFEQNIPGGNHKAEVHNNGIKQGIIGLLVLRKGVPSIVEPNMPTKLTDNLINSLFTGYLAGRRGATQAEKNLFRNVDIEVLIKHLDTAGDYPEVHNLRRDVAVALDGASVPEKKQIIKDELGVEANDAMVAGSPEQRSQFVRWLLSNVAKPRIVDGEFELINEPTYRKRRP